MGATRLASGIKERLTDRHVISAVCESLFSSVWAFSLMPDAGRVAPIRACAWWLRLVLAFSGSGTFYHTTTTYTPSILHLTLIRYNSLIINILLSVRCCQFYLHATYTPHMLPHGTSAGDRYHSIGEQESLLLRQIVLRPSGVQPAAYVQTDCKIYAGACKIFWNHLTHLKPLYINLLRAKSVRWQWKHTHSFTSGLTGRAQLFVYKLYTFFVGCNTLVLPLQHFNSTLILY